MNRNIEVFEAIKEAKSVDLVNRQGSATLANALASQNVAESTQRLQISLENSVDKLIESNKKLSDSNNRYAFALNILTGALVFVGILGLLINLIK